MSDKDLGKALLDLEAHHLSGAADTQSQTWKILERDRSRVWWWTAATYALWGLSIFMVLLMMVLYGLIFPLQAKLAGQTDEQQPAAAAQLPRQRIRVEDLTPEQLETAKFKAQIMFQMITVGVTLSVGVLSFAALSTIFLVSASRRATLRQINASLLVISQQLKELKESSAKPSQS